MKVLVIQGAGMELRGHRDVEIFGPETLTEINARIEAEAGSLGIEVEIIQSNEETDLVERLGRAADRFDAVLINPSGFTTSEGPLPDAITAAGLPVYEVHASNPSARGVRSSITPVCRGAVCGFGYDGYRIALMGLVGV